MATAQFPAKEVRPFVRKIAEAGGRGEYKIQNVIWVPGIGGFGMSWTHFPALKLSMSSYCRGEYGENGAITGFREYGITFDGAGEEPITEQEYQFIHGAIVDYVNRCNAELRLKTHSAIAALS